MNAPITVTVFPAPLVDAVSTDTRTVSSLDELASLISQNAWTPGTFTGGHRTKETFEREFVIGLDVDGGLPLADALARLKELGVAAIVATTKSHQRDKVHAQARFKPDGSRTPAVTSPPCDRYRVIVPLSRAITNEAEHAATWKGLADALGAKAVDPSCKDASRFFWPSTPVEVLKGRSVEPRRPEPNAMASRSDGRKTERQEYLAAVDRACLLTRADAYVNGEKFPMSIAGERGHTVLLKVAVALRKGFGLTFDEAWPIFQKFNRTKADPESDEQLEHKLNDAVNTSWNTERWNVDGFLITDTDLDEFRRAREVASAAPLTLPNPRTPKPDWRPLSKFLAEVHPPPRYLCKPFLTAGSLTFVTAAPSSLKTWLVFHLALDAARQGSKVLLVLEEGRPYSLQKRFRQLGGDSDSLFVLPRTNLRIDDRMQWQAFAAGVKDEHFDLVIADPLADLHEEEESDGPAMRRLINQFKTLIVDTGAAVVLVHHTVKSSWGGANKDRPAAMLSDARGAGGQMGSADLAIALVRGGKTEDPNIRTADIYTTKDKDNVVPGAFPEAPSRVLTMTWDSENRTASVKLEDAAPLRLERKQAKVQKEKDTVVQAQQFVRQVLHKSALSLTSVVKLARAERVKGFPTAVERELLRLEQTGGVERICGPKAGTHLFRVRQDATPSESPYFRGGYE